MVGIFDDRYWFLEAAHVNAFDGGEWCAHDVRAESSLLCPCALTFPYQAMMQPVSLIVFVWVDQFVEEKVSPLWLLAIIYPL